MPILVPSLLTLLAAQLFDLATFVTMVRRLGPRAEVNPFVSEMLGAGGLPELVLAKLALIVLVGATAVVLLRARGARFQRVGAVLLACGIAAGVFGGWTNAITIGSI